jgi:hypothetical protein
MDKIEKIEDEKEETEEVENDNKNNVIEEEKEIKTNDANYDPPDVRASGDAVDRLL